MNLLRRLIWFALATVLGVALARIAMWLQAAGFAKLLATPIAFGAALGFGVAWIAIQMGEKDWRLIVAGAVLAAVLMAAAEHGFSYLDYRRNFAVKLQSDPKAQLAATFNPEQFEPASFSVFMETEAPAKWLLWTVDGLAMIAVAAVTAWWVTPHRSS